MFENYIINSDTWCYDLTGLIFWSIVCTIEEKCFLAFSDILDFFFFMFFIFFFGVERTHTMMGCELLCSTFWSWTAMATAAVILHLELCSQLEFSFIGWWIFIFGVVVHSTFWFFLGKWLHVFLIVIFSFLIGFI